MILPIDELIPEILKQASASHNLVVTASPGSGKTTRIPPALLNSSTILPNKKILVLVPRRVAAKYAALRVASEYGEECGQTIGYQFRFEKKVGPKTRLLFITEGLLMRFMIGDSQLSDVGCVILDEFHERHLHTDLAFTLLKNLQNTSRPDLKILVMSATIDAERVAKALDDCPIISQVSPPHPLAVHYQPLREREKLEEGVLRVTRKVLSQDFSTHGHILVFLPGMAQIRRCEEGLRPLESRTLSDPDCVILPLHGDLSRADQDLIFSETKKTKIILATNIAESSVTIPGVKTVIDSGLHRQARFSAWSGLPALMTVPVSQASATQRAGRAARTGAGQCIRLYEEYDLSARLPFDSPEIRRAELTQALLELMACGLNHFDAIPWFESPPAGSVKQAVSLLSFLGAVEEGRLTDLGRRMTTLPMHPRLARLLIAASSSNFFQEALLLTARLSEGELENINLLDDLHVSRLSDNVRRAVSSWNDLLVDQTNSRGKNNSQNESGVEVRTQALASFFFKAFPDRVAKIRARHVRLGNKLVDEWVLASGGEVFVDSGKISTEQNYLIIIDARASSNQKGGKSPPWINHYIPINEEQLLDGPKEFLIDSSLLAWDAQREAIFKTDELKYGDIILSSSKVPSDDLEAIRTLFVRQVFKWDLSKADSLNTTDIEHELKHFQEPENFLSAWARIELLQKFQKINQEIVASPGAAFKLAVLGISQMRELREQGLGDRLLNQLPSEVLGQIHQLLPTSLKLPSGRQVSIHYAPGQKPWIESRLQDFFGLKKTPTILNGRLMLNVHLLAPNKRALQVTNDLESFWKTAYPELRQQLMRRYPRHDWPVL